MSEEFDDREERLSELYELVEYLSGRGGVTQMNAAITEFGMSKWDSEPSAHDFRQIFSIAIRHITKDIHTKYIKPIEKELLKEETESLRGSGYSESAARARRKRKNAK
jgi:hypothetical protein